MTPVYLSSHHVPIEGDDPLDAARCHRLAQHQDTAPIYEVTETDTETIHIVDLDTGEVRER